MKKLWQWFLKRTKHDYQITDKTISDFITIKYHDGRIDKREIILYLYICSYCNEGKYFSQKWDKQSMKFFNKCKKGECI
jgi:hypothetical protein